MNLMKLYHNEVRSDGSLRRVKQTPEERKRKLKEYQQANLDKYRANNRRWIELNPEKAKEIQLRYKQKKEADPQYLEKKRESNKKRRANNAAAATKTKSPDKRREHAREYMRNWRERNPEKVKESQKKCREKKRLDPQAWEKRLASRREYTRRVRAAKKAAAANKQE